MAAREAKTVYLYDPTTGEHTGQDKAWRSPLDTEEEVFHLPANSTLAKPPTLQEGEAAVWNGTAWSAVPDLRGGVAYDTITGAGRRIERLGPLPETLTPSPRPSLAHTFVAGAWQEDAVLKAAELEAARGPARQRIDEAAESTRLRFITGGAGQALVYVEKRAEAERFLALPADPETFDDFPLIRAEVLRTQSLARPIAEAWKAKADLWREAAAAIETIRLDGHAATERAADITSIAAAVDDAAALFETVGA